MKIILGIILLTVVGCGSQVAKLRARLVSIDGHARDIRASVADYRSEQPPEATEPPQIAQIDQSAQSIVGEVKIAYKASEGVQDRPNLLEQIGTFLWIAGLVVLFVGGVMVYLVMRSKLIRTGVALSAVAAGVDPGGLPRIVSKVIKSV